MSIVTRICHRCKVKQPITEFYVEAEARATIRRKKQTKLPCRDCNQKAYFERRKPRQDYIEVVKRENGCADCGLVPDVLEFDHRPDEHKTTDVSNLMASGSWEAFISEVAKCDVVCANCHRIRTVQRRQLGGQRGRIVQRKVQQAIDKIAGLDVWKSDLAPVEPSPTVKKLEMESLFEVPK
ncbi:hypothetical protein [Pseudarthrobacter albicanus]|uniref:hypothetical protein n=1 Tax=Pseudarthrobacter albicanus TaxID=2823873 RepID=UPI001BA9184D|nr:hypothetical protein [Pseudarthrobacter albicanus]